MTEADKDRLAKIMAFGKDADNWPKVNKYVEEEEYEPEPEMDRFDELQLEINDRVAFLESMTELGRRKQYEAIIKTEISQVIIKINQ